ncbi:MAG: D-alanyl-D-alanine carboxypeptidase family protein [Clostridia bacterium]|nr:D-alanyl-D-alanine carboxypeptidase family protein [Clostridia bacterium]
MSSFTGRYSVTGSSYGIRSKRKRRRRTVLLAVLAILIVILFVAVIFIIKDLIEQKKNDPIKPTPGTSDTGGIIDTGSHKIEMAFDADPLTYYKSPAPQTGGAWFIVDLGSEIEIGKISIVSNHASDYIRQADISISSDKETWKSVGTFTGAPGDATEHDFKGENARASYVRIMLTASAAENWVINEVKIINSSFDSVKPRSGSSGSPSSGDTQAPSVTTAPVGGDTTIVKSNADIHTGTLILVGPVNQYVFPASDANIQDMYDSRTVFTVDGKTVYSYSVGGSKTSLLDSAALTAFNKMTDAFYKETGILSLHVGANAGYRSYETQADLASKYSTAAAPGFSDHNTGLSANIDIYENGAVYTLDSTLNPSCGTALAWLEGNAHKYGFIDRYPASKDSITGLSIDRYHYRYVGYPHSYYMKAHNYCLEEYLIFLEASCDVGGTHLEFTDDTGHAYEIYFVRASAGETTTVPVPNGYSYTISGNNYSGFMVTVSK